MESKFTIIVLIILIGTLSIVLGVMFGRLTHQFSAKHESSEEVVEMIKENPADIEPEEKNTEDTQSLFKTYLMISIDRNVVIHNKKVLDKYGYKSSIIQTERNEKKVYSLVLDGEYSHPEAKLLGEEIQDKFPTINTYWLEEANGEEPDSAPIEVVEATKEPEVKKPETKVEPTKPKAKEAPPTFDKPKTESKGPKYVIQLLANTNKKSIEAKKKILDSNGYKTVISSIKRDGTTFYRLRVDGTFSEQEGKQLGNKIKSEFSFIEGFWLAKS